MVKLGFSFYKKKNKNREKLWENWESWETKSSNISEEREKYKTIIKVLDDMGINLDEVSFFEEKNLSEEGSKKNWERNSPYKALQVRDDKKDLSMTILVCDENTQSTIIYDWIFDIEKIENVSKGERIEGYTPYIIPYNWDFSERLKSQIELLSFYRYKEEDYIKELESLWIEESLIKKYAYDIARFRFFFDKMLWILKSDYWVVEEEGKIFIPFDLSKLSIGKLPKIWWYSFSSRPSIAFNKSQEYTKDDNWKLLNNWKLFNNSQFISMLKAVWYNIADLDDWKERLRWIIQKNYQEFEKIGIYYENYSWYFWDMRGDTQELEIWGYNINDFRTPEFTNENYRKTSFYNDRQKRLSRNGKKEKWLITKIRTTHLKFLFQTLGIKNIATQKQEEERWVKLLHSEYNEHKEDFNNAGVLFREDKWYISKRALSNFKELKVWTKMIYFFPSIDFNVEKLETYKIGKNKKSYQRRTYREKGCISSKEEFKIILESLREKCFIVNSDEFMTLIDAA